MKDGYIVEGRLKTMVEWTVPLEAAAQLNATVNKGVVKAAAPVRSYTVEYC